MPKCLGNPDGNPDPNRTNPHPIHTCVPNAGDLWRRDNQRLPERKCERDGKCEGTQHVMRKLE